MIATAMLVFSAVIAAAEYFGRQDRHEDQLTWRDGLLVGIAGAWTLHRWARKRQEATGQPFPSILAGFGVALGVPALVWLLGGAPHHMSWPELKGFNFQGGTVIQPEFTALLLGLVLYTSAFVAEIVRSGILALHKGQSEAASALGLSRGQVMRLVLLPQAKALRRVSVLALLALQASFLVPPTGYAVMMARSQMRQKTALPPLVRALAPFIAAQFAVLALVVAVPKLAHIAQPKGHDAPSINTKIDEDEARRKFNDMLKIPAPE